MKKSVKWGSIALAGTALCAVAARKSIRQKRRPCVPKKAILAVSFGTSYDKTREETIGAIERTLQAAYPDWIVRRAFTSHTIVRKLREEDGIHVDSVEEALEQMVQEGIRDVVVQSLHVTPGIEYDEMVAAVSTYRRSFAHLWIGQPVLETENDYTELAQILLRETNGEQGEKTAIVWMGHGTKHRANTAYTRMQEALLRCGGRWHFVGTVEATPTLEDVVTRVKEAGAEKVVLLPMMIVAGDHANNDMAGSDESSWRSRFAREGLEVVPVLRGMGQYRGVQEMLLRHVREAMAARKALRRPI